MSFKNFQKSNINVANVQCFYHFKANIETAARTKQQETVRILHLTNTRQPVWRCNAMYTGYLGTLLYHLGTLPVVIQWSASGQQVVTKWHQVVTKWSSSGQQVWSSSGHKVVIKWSPSGHQVVTISGPY